MVNQCGKNEHGRDHISGNLAGCPETQPTAKSAAGTKPRNATAGHGADPRGVDRGTGSAAGFRPFDDVESLRNKYANPALDALTDAQLSADIHEAATEWEKEPDEF
jgi:hypothetical protein